MLKKRIINIRVMFAIFCGLMIGILFPYLLTQESVNISTLVIFGLLIAFLVIGFFLYADLTHKHNLKIEYREEVSPLIKCASIGFFVAFVVGMVITIQPILSIFSLTDYGNNEVTVTGIVTDYVQDETNYNKFLVTDCSIDNGNKILNIDYKVCVYATNNVNVELGDIITFKSVLDKYRYNKQSDFIKLTQGIAYKVFVDNTQVTIAKGSPSLKDIKQNTKEILDNNLNEDNSNIFYAILFGEKQGLNDSISQMFSYAGISHILAVSGLHIGVLVSLLYFILKKIKMNRFVRLSILGVILLFYSYLCSFTPSVCRASIMAMLVAFCDVMYLAYDGLSGLSIAGIIILLFNPFALFSISFQLSFLCVFAIISIAPKLTKYLTKLKIPKFLASSLAISIATNLVILPICLNSFTKVSLLGVITNIFVLPIFSIVYILLFFVVVLSWLWSGLGFLLFAPNLFLHIIKIIANGVANLPIGIYKVFNISYWALVLFVFASIIFHFLMVRKFIKGSAIAILLIVITSMFVASVKPNTYANDNFIFSLKYKSNACYYICNNETTLIGSDIDSDMIIRELKDFRIKKINTIIAYDFQLNDMDNLIELCQECDVDSVYIPKKYQSNQVEQKFKNVKFFVTNIVIGSLKFKAINLKDQTIGVHLYVDQIGNILIPEIKPTLDESEYLCKNYTDVDYVYINNDNIKIDLDILKPKCIISNEDCARGDVELEKIDKFILNKTTMEELI